MKLPRGLDFADGGLTQTGGNRGRANNLTFGVNWYWTPQLRLMLNYVHSRVDDSDSGNDATIDAVTTRCQIDF